MYSIYIYLLHIPVFVRLYIYIYIYIRRLSDDVFESVRRRTIFDELFVRVDPRDRLRRVGSLRRRLR